VLESAGPALDPVKASRMLLWYDGLAGLPGPDYRLADEWQLGLRESTEGLRQHMLWRQEALRHLESPTFQARLAALDPAVAGRALASVEQIRASLVATRAWIAYRASAALLSAPLGGGGAAREAPPVVGSVERALLEVLSLVGLDARELVDSSSGLREMTVTGVEPHLRLIYGIDVPKRRVVALLGEPLDRAYYGDSVRLAERLWRESREAEAPGAEAR
jgi:hypothetical protein